MKTNKAARKRFRITKNKKVLSRSSFRRHMMTDRTAKKKRQSRKVRPVDRADVKRVLKMLPYGK